MTNRNYRIHAELEAKRRKYREEDHRRGSWEVYVEHGGPDDIDAEEHYMEHGGLPDNATDAQRALMKQAEQLAVD